MQWKRNVSVSTTSKPALRTSASNSARAERPVREVHLTAATRQPEQAHGRRPRRVQHLRDAGAGVVGRDDERPAWTEYAMQLTERPRRVEHVLDHLRAQDEVEVAVREGKCLEVGAPSSASMPAEPVAAAAVRRIDSAMSTPTTRVGTCPSDGSAAR